MRQELPQSASELLGGQLHAAQHPFDDVAVVAKQTSGLAAVVAMIGAYLSALKTLLANAAAVVLNNEQRIHLGSANPGSTAALGINLLRPRHRIISDLLILLALSALALWRLFKLASAGGGLGGVLSRFSPRLHLRALGVFSPLGTEPIAVLNPVLPVPLKLGGPLFGSAISLSHPTYTAHHSRGLNRAVA